MTNLMFTIIATNIDSFNVGLSFGLQNIKITKRKITMISIFLAIMTFLSLTFGDYIASYIPETISRIIGAFIFLLFAIFSYKETKKEKNTNHFLQKLTYPQQHDLNCDKKISSKEAFLIAITLTIDAFIVALTLTTPYSNLFVASVFGISNFLFLFSGTLIANTTFIKKVTKKIEYIPSILFLILAVMRLI